MLANQLDPGNPNDNLYIRSESRTFNYQALNKTKRQMFWLVTRGTTQGHIICSLDTKPYYSITQVPKAFRA